MNGSPWDDDWMALANLDDDNPHLDPNTCGCSDCVEMVARFQDLVACELAWQMPAYQPGGPS